MRLADRYILRNHVGPFLLGLSVLTFIFIINLFYDLLEMFLVNKVPAKIIFELVILSLGHIFALTIPMAVLVSTMMALSQMVAENEITAMRTGGISLYRIIAAPLVAAFFLTIGLFLFSNFVLPQTNHRLKNLLVAVKSKKPALSIKPGRFIQDLPGYTLFARDKDDVTNELTSLLIFKEERGKGPTVISARTANFESDDEKDLMTMALVDGEQFETSFSTPGEFQITVFDNMDILMHDIDDDLKRHESSHRGDREMSVEMMNERIANSFAEIDRLHLSMVDLVDKQFAKMTGMLDRETRHGYLISKGYMQAPGDSLLTRRRGRSPRGIQDEENTLRSLSNKLLSVTAKQKRITAYKVEIHKKYSIPVACVLFILMGAPIAIKTGRSGTGWGISFSLVLFVIYYIFLSTGENLADRELLPPWFVMWAPNILLLFFGSTLLYATNRESRPIALFTRLNTWLAARKGARA
ncbi:MAG: YjgP/YjgQ family permease [bacterium]|nr:YjgP/YjgQ family permease [bacterium]